MPQCLALPALPVPPALPAPVTLSPVHIPLNLVSSPGSGKTTLLERTLRDLKGRHAISVIEGDQATLNASRLPRA